VNPPIRLAVLDMAGTTIADDGVVVRAFAEALDDVGGVGDDCPVGDPFSFVARTMGQSKIVVFRQLFAGDDARARRANAAFESAYDRAVDRGDVAPLAGAPEAIARLRAGGVRVCLTTGFSPATRDRILTAVGWTGSIDLALSPQDAGRGRPWPDMILTAVIRLGIDDVREVAVAGDTANDLLSGWRAGAAVVAGVLSGAHDRRRLASAPHTHILTTVADLPGLVLAMDTPEVSP
jgi:phosphonatase-like hydrolase